MPQTIRNKIETLRVVNEAGQCAEFIVSTPIVTETMLDGTTVTFSKLATITTPYGEHVNRSGEEDFKTLSGVHWKLMK